MTKLAGFKKIYIIFTIFATLSKDSESRPEQ
jgi:hypothetical protein